MIENWVSLKRTVDFVRIVTGSPLGPACQTLIAICESGEVRARWTDHYSRTLPAIHKREWVGADIDWSTFRVCKADGTTFMRGVDFSEDDLNHWAAAREISIDPPAVVEATSGQTRRLTKKSAVEYVAAYIREAVNPTIDDLRARAIGDKIRGGREIYEPEFRKQMLARGHVVRPGRRNEPRAN